MRQVGREKGGSRKGQGQGGGQEDTYRRGHQGVQGSGQNRKGAQEEGKGAQPQKRKGDARFHQGPQEATRRSRQETRNRHRDAYQVDAKHERLCRGTQV